MGTPFLFLYDLPSPYKSVSLLKRAGIQFKKVKYIS
jgi:hypothetical protein